MRFGSRGARFWLASPLVLGAVALMPATAARAGSIAPPVSSGTLTVTGTLQDGASVQASGLSWSAGKLPAGDQVLSLEVAYTWSSCSASTKVCVKAADTTSTPYAASTYVVGHADTGRTLEVKETATEVVGTVASSAAPVSASVTSTPTSAVSAYPAGTAPRTEFVNGTPESTTGSRTEYFSVDPPHYNSSKGAPTTTYRIDTGGWKAMPSNDVFYTGELSLGQHSVAVRTSDSAGSSVVSFGWKVVPLPAPVSCVPRAGQACWYPPHLGSNGRPLRWDWQLGASTPVQRTGVGAVDLYDVDGFLTTAGEVNAIHTTWQAATLPHPKAVCYFDLAWEDYRPDANPPGSGGRFPVATLGNVYNGYPQERWVDLRQLSALEPMLTERIGMCARKGFDAVEIDDIDSFDPPGTTGFHLTPGDAQNLLAFAFNLIHQDGMTALWKNSALLSSWGRQYADGAVVEECYVGKDCFASQMSGDRQYGITCTPLSGAMPCGWDDFTTDVTANQPNGKWVGEAEYLQDHYVCQPGATTCSGRQKTFAAYCHDMYAPTYGFSAVLFTVDLNAKVFDPCPKGT
jgi:hypothetical protein